jgi:hydrogenase nickel incorporation protein HypA/HybF
MGVVEYLKKLSSDQGLCRIEAVYLEVGDLAHVDPRQLRYSFKIASEGTVAEDSRLYIRRKGAAIRCSKCGRESKFQLLKSLTDFELKCPFCGSPDVEIDKGRELLLKRVKGVKEKMDGQIAWSDRQGP